MQSPNEHSVMEAEIELYLKDFPEMTREEVIETIRTIENYYFRDNNEGN